MRNEDFATVGSLSDSQGTRFSEFERSNLDNFKLVELVIQNVTLDNFIEEKIF